METIYKELPTVQKQIYMNTGAAGPLLVRTIQAIQNEQLFELDNGRMGKEAFQRRDREMTEVRNLLAELIKARTEEIAITQSTTEGLNMVLRGMNWQKGDEVITSNVEHPAVLLPLFLLRQEFGVEIKIAVFSDEVQKTVQPLINSKTKLIAFSHVSYSTGEILPVKEISDLAHYHGIPILVDGAQAVGAIPVDVKELGVDYYSLPGQKWLCGPQGTGALYISQKQLETISPTFIGLGSVHTFVPNGTIQWHQDMRRFEGGMPYLPAITGLKASISWLIKEVGLDWIFERTQKLGQRLRIDLASIPGVTLVTPPQAAGLTSFCLEGRNPGQLRDYLARKNINLRTVDELGCVRASVAFFNTEDELDTLIKAVADMK